MFRALRNRYPEANVVSVDFDPGASEVNQPNRIKLMLSTATSQHAGGSKLDFSAAQSLDWGEKPQDLGCDGCALLQLVPKDKATQGRSQVRLGLPKLRERQPVG